MGQPEVDIAQANAMKWFVTLDGWIVLVHKMTLDQLDSQARLADSAAADNDKFVLSEEL